MKNKNWREQYPLNTFSGTTRQELEEFIDGLLNKQLEEILGLEGLKEEKIIGFSIYKDKTRIIKNQLRSRIKQQIIDCKNK